MGLAEWRMLQIARDTVKNPNKALLGGPTVAEAKKIIADAKKNPKKYKRN